MNHYSIDDLIARWKREELTIEQMIGQILLVLQSHEQRLRTLARPDPPAEPNPGGAPQGGAPGRGRGR